MNAQTFELIRTLMIDRGIDCFDAPDLPPLDMGDDAVRDVSRALSSLGEALGLDFHFSEYQPLFGLASRTNTQIELHLLNVQLALFRAMIILGYDFDRMEAAMRRMVARQLQPITPHA